MNFVIIKKKLLPALKTERPFSLVSEKEWEQVTTGKIGTKGVNPNPRCIKKSKFITQNKWAMHLFNLSILIMHSSMSLETEKWLHSLKRL